MHFRGEEKMRHLGFFICIAISANFAQAESHAETPKAMVIPHHGLQAFENRGNRNWDTKCLTSLNSVYSKFLFCLDSMSASVLAF